MEITIQMRFSPESLNIDSKDVKAAMALKKNSAKKGQFLKAMQSILSGTPLSRMKVSTTAMHSGCVTLDNDIKEDSIIFIATEQLPLDTINQFIRIEDRYREPPPKEIILTCTITESSLPKKQLSRGFYNKPTQKVFGRVLKVPAAKDQNRLRITLYGKSIPSIKQAFFEMINGEWSPNNT